jgi:hypothetical protein
MTSPFGKHTALVLLAFAFFSAAILMRILLADVFGISDLAALIPVAIVLAAVWLLKKSASLWKSKRITALTTTAITLSGVYFHTIESEESINEIRFWLLKSHHEQNLKVIHEAITSGKTQSEFRRDTAFGVDVGPPIRVVFPLRGELFSDRWYAIANDPTGKILRANEPESGGHIAPAWGDRRYFVSARHLTGDWYLCIYHHSGEG